MSFFLKIFLDFHCIQNRNSAYQFLLKTDLAMGFSQILIEISIFTYTDPNALIFDRIPVYTPSVFLSNDKKKSVSLNS